MAEQKQGRLARTYIEQLCEDTGCSPEDLPEAMNDSEEWWERVRDIRAGGTTWWWCIFIIINKYFGVTNTTIFLRGELHGVMTSVYNGDIPVSHFYSSKAIMFTYGLMPVWKRIDSFILPAMG